MLIGMARKGVSLLDKEILNQYIDAIELVEETKKEIQRLNQKKKTIIQTNVSGSNPDFPYQPQHFKIAGISITFKEYAQLHYEEKLLEERIANAEKIKLQVQEYLNILPPRMQRIVRMKHFENNSWKDIARKLGRNATADSVRMEYNNFIKKIK